MFDSVEKDDSALESHAFVGATATTFAQTAASLGSVADALFWNVSICSSSARRNGSKTFLTAEATPELPYSLAP